MASGSCACGHYGLLFGGRCLKCIQEQATQPRSGSEPSHADLRPQRRERLWIWTWVGGGYNSCLARSRKDALAKAKEMASGTSLVMNEASLHEGTNEELLAIDRQFAGMFD